MTNHDRIREMGEQAKARVSAEAAAVLAEAVRFFEEAEAELNRRHAKRIAELRDYQRWSYYFVAFAVVFLVIQLAELALRIWG